MEAMTGGVRKFPERISYLNDKQGRSASLDCSSAHDEEVSHVPIGKAFCMWDVASRKVCMELVVSELEGHGTTRNCMPKDIKIRRGERRQLTHVTFFSPLRRIRVRSSRGA